MVASKIMKKMLQTRGQHHFMICLHKQLDIFCRRRKRLPGSLLFVPLCVCVSPCLHQGVYLPVCMAEGVFVQPLKAQPISPCVSLLWGSWGPACSCVQHPDPDTSCIHRHRPPLPFDVRSVGQPLTTDTLCIHQPSPVSKKKKKGKKQLTLIYMFLLSNWEEKLFDICAQKTSCSALGTLGCLTDWLHGQSSQGLSLCPTAFQTAPGLREFCLRQKNDKLELHFPKSECLGLD